ncbi:MAG: type II toxin-antitoxin system VapC family toxin [Gemmataceae bacterium]
MLVVDASVALAWVFPDEASAATEAVLRRVGDEGGLVPAVWPLEVANALVGGERTGRLARADARRAFALYAGLPLKVCPVGPGLDTGLGQVVALARRHALTTYDAAYLELAVRTGTPLATLDRRLAAAAVAERVELAVAA